MPSKIMPPARVEPMSDIPNQTIMHAQYLLRLTMYPHEAVLQSFPKRYLEIVLLGVTVCLGPEDLVAGLMLFPLPSPLLFPLLP